MVILSLFHGLIHVPNAHMGKLTPRTETWGFAPRHPFFLVHSRGCGHSRVEWEIGVGINGDG